MILCDGAGSDFGRGMSDVGRIDKLLSGLDEASKDLVRGQLSDCIGAYEIDPNFCYKVSLSGTEIESLRALRNFRHQIAEVEVFNEATGKSEKAYTWGGLYLPHNFFEYQVIFYRHSLHLFKNLDRTKAVLDCGACLGDSSLVFEKLCGFSGEIHAFEPTKRNFALMQRTIALNNLQNVIPVNLGVGSEKGSVFIENSGLGNVGASKITKGSAAVESKSHSTKQIAKEAKSS